jgi:diguanylate cyclase (GGDEF)-like protein/PAS domain S-box-containing protein
VANESGIGAASAKPRVVAGDVWAGLELVADPVVVVDSALCVVEANSAAEAFFGASKDAWLGRAPLELVYPDDLNLVLSSQAEAVGKERGTPIEVRVRVADGSYRLVEILGGARETDRGLVVVLTFRDLTERRRWELAADQPEVFRSLVETMPVVVALVDRSGRFESVSGAFTRRLGHDPTRVVGHLLVEFVPAADRDRIADAFSRATQTPGTSQIVADLCHLEGSAIPFELTITNLLDDPVVSGVVVCGIDISERQHAAHQLAMAARRFEVVLDSMSDLVCVIDRDANMTYVNETATRLIGRSPANHVGKSMFEFIHPEDAGRVAETFVSERDTPGPVAPLEIRLLHRDGTFHTFEVSANNLLEDPAINGIVINSRDVTSRRRVEASLHDAQARFEQVFETAALGITLVTLDGRFQRVNAAYCRMLGYSAPELLTRTLFDNTHLADVARTRELFDALIAGDIDNYAIDKRLVRTDGSLLWTHVSASIVRNDAGQPQYTIHLVSDTSDVHELTEELERRASHDYLTGVAARSVLPDHLERALAQVRRSPEQSLAVLAIDLDGFKQVNDRLGHKAGDEVLIEAARRLQAIVRTGDLVVRVGGDEFVVVLTPITDPDTATDIAARVVESLARPVRVEAGEATIGASVGIAISTTGAETSDLLVTRADRAAYHAKERGRGRFELFERRLEARA